MNRRKFLTAVVASSTTVALTGCTGGGTMSPEEVSKAYYKQGLFAGDYEKATSYVEGDLNGELTESFVLEQETLAKQAEVEIVGSTLVSSTESEAVVDVVLSLTTPFGPQTQTTRFDLENIDGEWKIVSAERS